MRIEPELGSVSIVLVGNFSPPIFTPAWFARHGMLAEEEADRAAVDIIQPTMARFHTEKVFVRVEPNRFAAETSHMPFIRVLDFVLKTFREFLNHTPMTMLGINRIVHFSVGDEPTRARIGNMLAPLEPWGAWGAAIAASKGDMRGGMLSLTMQQKT